MGEKVPTGFCFRERVKHEYTGDPLKKVSIYLKYIAKAGMTAAEVDHMM